MKMAQGNGRPWGRMTEAGFGIYVRRMRIKYHQPAFFTDELEISTWAYNIKRSTGVRYYEILRVGDDCRIEQINTFAVWVNLENGRPIRIPENFFQSFQGNIV